MTETMHAITFQEPGNADVLQLSEVPRCQVGEHDLLIRIKAVGINRADTLQRKGFYPPPAGESDILGLEFAGEVVELGAKAQGFSVGDRVFGLVGSGAYAEYAVINCNHAMPIPQHLSFVQAAAVAEAFMTANETVFELGKLQKGEDILIHAGGSGVGTAAIQMAHHIGATVYFTAGSPEKIKAACALGAQAGIHYKTQDFATEISALTNGKGVDVVEDFLGASILQKNLSCLKVGGRLVLVGLMGGSKTTIDLQPVLRNRLQILATVMRSRTTQQKTEATQRFVERWLPIIAQGKVAPIVDSTFPLEQAAAAHQRMEDNANFGKIVLTVD